MHANSTPVHSTQQAAHARLAEVVAKHHAHRDQTPIAAHNAAAFNSVFPWFSQQAPRILDLGCGTAHSSAFLARSHPEARVLGVDQSSARLARAPALLANARVLHCEQYDWLRLAEQHGLTIEKGYLLYPNPWPKPEHLRRRWHGHPIWPTLLRRCETLELRSNWQIYAVEFVQALRLSGWQATFETIQPAQPISAFEAKYSASGHTLWRVLGGKRLYRGSVNSAARRVSFA